MLELVADAGFALTGNRVAGMTPERLKSAQFPHAMAFADGGLVIRAVCYDAHATAKDTVHIEIGDRGVLARDLSAHATAREGRRFSEKDWTSIPMEGGVLYVQGTAHAFWVGCNGGTIAEVRVAHGLGDIRINDKVSARLQPARHIHPVSQGNVAALALSDGATSGWLAFLHLDGAAKTAHWAPMADRGPARPGFFQRLLGQKADPSPMASSDLVRLDADDFPRRHAHAMDRPLINEAMVRDGRVFVFTKGATESPKWGYVCSDLVEIGGDGRVVRRLFSHDFTRTGDEKRRGFSARFTASGRYGLLASIYQATDPWGGRQKLLDMETGEVIDVAMPRGYGKFRIIDHAGDWFWAQSHDEPASWVRMTAK